MLQKTIFERHLLFKSKKKRLTVGKLCLPGSNPTMSKDFRAHVVCTELTAAVVVSLFSL